MSDVHTTLRAKPVLSIVFAALAMVALAFAASCGGEAKKGGYKAPPKRPGLNLPDWCPPANKNANDTYTKGAPGGDPDKDVNSDNRTDYFMGEYTFVQGERDFIVRIWCINKDPKKDAAGNPIGFNDYFTFELISSKSGAETVQQPPGGAI